MLDAILIVFGAIMLLAGWRSFSEHRRLQKEGVETVAKVVEIKEFLGQRKQVMYRPIWAFQDEEGNEHRIPGSSGHSTNRNSYTLGATRKVLYDPSAPHLGASDVGPRFYLSIALYLVAAAGVIVFAIARMSGLIESV
ncbi:MAG: DUF3592 domain-containing protein [Pseudomonadota bacterium]